MAKTNLILEEYKAGVLDEREAGEALFNYLFGEMTGSGGHDESLNCGITPLHCPTA